MKSQRSVQFVLAAAVLSATAATPGSPVFAAEHTTADVFAAVNNRGGIVPETLNIAVNSGNAMIDHLRKVELLLDSGAVAGARSVLTASREFVRELRFVKMEADRADARISDGIMPEYTRFSPLATDWVGIYSNLDELQAYAPELAQGTRDRLQEAEKRAERGDIQGAALTLQQVAAGVPYSLQPGQDIDQQMLLSLELLGENQPDIAAARRVVEKTLAMLTAVGDVETTPVTPS